MAAYFARSVSSSMRLSSSAFSASCLIFRLRLIQQPARCATPSIQSGQPSTAGLHASHAGDATQPLAARTAGCWLAHARNRKKVTAATTPTTMPTMAPVAGPLLVPGAGGAGGGGGGTVMLYTCTTGF